MIDYRTIAENCPRTGEKLFQRLHPMKKDMLEVSHEFYPLGVAGWERGVECIADKGFHDNAHRLMTIMPVLIARKAAAGMLQNLTSKGQPWFYLTVPKIAKGRLSTERKGILEKLTEATRYLMARSNCYSSIYRLFMHYLVYGHGCMLVSAADASSGDIVDTYTLRPGTYALGIGRNGRVNRVVRKFAWTPIEILEEFGKDATPGWIREMAKRRGEKYVTVWNLIEPHYSGELAEFDKVSKACELDASCCYRSIYWVEGAGRGGCDSAGREGTPGTGEGSVERHGILAVDGYDINPVIAPRLDCELGDSYGRGLGLDGLDIARCLQSLRYDGTKIVGDKSEPAYLVSSELKAEGGPRLGRGQITYVRFGEQRQNMIVPINPNPPAIDDIREYEVAVRQELETLFYIDAFTSMDLYRESIGKVTATQLAYAKSEGMQKLGAIVTNCECEFLNVLVNTMVRWTIKNRVAPLDDHALEVLATLEGQYGPEYVSPIHQARRFAELNGIQAWLQNVMLAKDASGDPINDPADIVNFDEVNRRVGDIVNVPQECMNDEKKVEAKRAARAKAAAQQQNAELIEKGAGVVNTLSKTPIGTDSLLAPLARSATGLGQ